MNSPSIFFLINPAAGKDEPVLEMIDRIFTHQKPLMVHVLKAGEDPVTVIKEQARDAGIVAVYGGDGTVTTAAAALIGTNKPLAIIPGGTANVLAKELGIPQDTEEALQLLCSGQYRLRTIDTGLINGRPFLLRINLGIMATMITETDPELKDKIGQLAYAVSTLKSARETEPVTYQLNMDGKQLSVKGVVLTITNSGSMGIGSLQLQPDIHVEDGLLDVVLLKDAGFLSAMKAAGSSLFGLKTDVVEHWTCKEVTVKLSKKQIYLCDDCEAEAEEIHIRVVPQSLTFITPHVE